ncbi:NTP/NDP exchange transporter [Aerolutibacter daejeonensis]|uniref:NTP/NDP exchange transporter n=1 Tax=Aerolutibacter daejeonensis TaxID=346181 RepID=UPI00068AE843|nr:MFS transporter [Lysobacter daejeonensis]
MRPANPEAPGRFRAALAESPPLWWSLLYFFSLLCGYYVLRPVRDAMGASGNVSDVFPHWLVAWAKGAGWDLAGLTLQVLFTITFVAMVVLQPLYGALVSRFPRRVFLPAVYLFFIACLLGFHWMFNQEWTGRGAAFFVWTAVFNLFAVSVFWSFMADVFDNTQAKLFYGYIGAGGTIGALVGPVLTRVLVQRIGVDSLLLISAGFLAVCLLCIMKLRPWALRSELVRGEGSGEAAMGGSVLAGIRLVLSDPLLRALAMLMFFGVGVGTLLYNEQAAIAKASFIADEARTAYYANIDLAINALTITTQLLVTRWLLRRYGIAPALLLPAAAIVVGFAMLAASPLPLLVATVQVMTRSSEFSLGKPARETIYTRVDRESRYKAKAVIDTVVYRGSDLSFVWLHKFLAAFGSATVFATGVGAAALFLFSAWRVVREQPPASAGAPAAT